MRETAAKWARCARLGSSLSASTTEALEFSLKAFLQSLVAQTKCGLASSSILTEWTSLAAPPADIPSWTGSR